MTTYDSSRTTTRSGVAPLVSFIVPVHNVEAYVGETLDSILSQNEARIEVICIDDASSDNSPRVLEAYARRDERIIVVRQEKNQGPSVARNRGLAMARGKWLVFIDSDDLVSPSLCSESLAAAERDGADLVLCDYRMFRDGEKCDLTVYGPGRGAFAAPRADLLLMKSFMGTKFISAEIFRSQNIEFPVGLIMQDVFVHWRLVLEARRPLRLERTFLWYRQRAASISYDITWKRADGFRVYDLTRRYLESSGRWGEYEPQFLRQELGYFADVLLNFVGRDPALLQRAHAEVMARMSRGHWQLACEGVGVSGRKRDYILSCCRPEGVKRSVDQLAPYVRLKVWLALKYIWQMSSACVARG